jgi:hypothetical protein
MTSDFNEFPYIFVVARFYSEFLLGFIHAVVQITSRLFVVLHGGPLSLPAVLTIRNDFSITSQMKE